MHCKSFSPIARKDAIILILGSLPGAESLRKRQYYGKKGNSFWPIMGELVGASPELSYTKRVHVLLEKKLQSGTCAVLLLESGVLIQVLNHLPLL